MLPGELQLPSVDGDDCDRKMVLRHLEAVLDRDVVGTSGMFGRELPASRPELDPGQPPRCARDARLVSLAPLLKLVLEKRASLPSLRGRREGIDDCLRRLANEVLPADGVR